MNYRYNGATMRIRNGRVEYWHPTKLCWRESAILPDTLKNAGDAMPEWPENRNMIVDREGWHFP